MEKEITKMNEIPSQEIVVKTLLEESKKVLENWGKDVRAKIKSKADEYYRVLSDINKMPHLFVLGCVMDRQINADIAWDIPYKVCEHFNTWDIAQLVNIGEKEFMNYFVTNKLHRFPNDMGECFYEAVKIIHDDYNDDASNIWNNGVSSATVICRFLKFKGCGIKISTMATNILQRDAGVQFSDYSAIDVSPDVQVRRILFRLGLISDESDTTMTVYKAKEINPTFPGIIDLACWIWGRELCNPTNPFCIQCPLNDVCRKEGLNLAQTKVNKSPAKKKRTTTKKNKNG